MEDLSVYYEDKFIKRNAEITGVHLGNPRRALNSPEENKNGTRIAKKEGIILNEIVQKFRLIIDEKPSGNPIPALFSLIRIGSRLYRGECNWWHYEEGDDR